MVQAHATSQRGTAVPGTAVRVLNLVSMLVPAGTKYITVIDIP
jgi:hypothetical protein